MRNNVGRQDVLMLGANNIDGPEEGGSAEVDIRGFDAVTVCVLADGIESDDGTFTFRLQHRPGIEEEEDFEDVPADMRSGDLTVVNAVEEYPQFRQVAYLGDKPIIRVAWTVETGTNVGMVIIAAILGNPARQPVAAPSLILV